MRLRPSTPAELRPPTPEKSSQPDDPVAPGRATRVTIRDLLGELHPSGARTIVAPELVDLLVRVYVDQVTPTAATLSSCTSNAELRFAIR